MNAIPDLDKKGLRKFALTTGAAFGLIFGLSLPWLFDLSYPVWPWVLMAILWIWALGSPSSIRPVYEVWMKIALLISKVTTPTGT